MLFQVFWYQIFENPTKIELWRIFRMKYIQVLKLSEFLIVRFSTLNISLLKFSRAQFWSDFQIFGTKMLGRAFTILKIYIKNEIMDNLSQKT